ncbi:MULTISPECIES: hypothetical protein [unclassified Mesorhizobium]|uniref:hypothetical protein n=1 Tax=unclassified Mesorhizobium TaxID=325217 RepID=UPI001FDF37DF|nr:MULTISPECIES: hypothetical protein [unclassified Mesorhizobium]
MERYLRLYPDYAAELVELSRELSREVYNDDAAPLSAADQALIGAAWSRHAATMPAAMSDPFAALTVDDRRAVAQRLELPRQVVTALRERRVLLVSIPRRFLQRLAEAIGSTVAQLQVLIDAGVPAETRDRLLAEAE